MEQVMKPIRSVAFVGIGAVGSIYAQCFTSNKKGIQSCAVVRDPDSYRQDPVTINGKPIEIPIVSASQVVKPVDLVLLSVKTYHLDKAIGDMEPLVGPDTQILSLLNGIDSEEALIRAFGPEHVLYAICSGIDANRAGHRVTMNRRGEIWFGESRNDTFTERVAQIRVVFEGVGLPYRIPLDMQKALWWKFMVNVGVNQVSALKGLCYGEMRKDPAAMDLMRQAQEEVLLLAQASGVSLTRQDICAWEEQLQTLSPEGRASTLQDLWQHRKTEVESFGGEVLRRGRLLDVETPVNAMLLEEIHALERQYGINKLT
jgi:2-dehydropantoate 2-reductase